MALPDAIHDPSFLGFDPAELEARYRSERDKRVRSDGEKQFVALDTTGDLAAFVAADPHSPVRPRDAVEDEIEVVVIGAGWAGLTTAARLSERGVDDVRIIDAGGDFGGTWYWNRYPGCCCDTESYIYLPLLEEMGYMPTERYATAAEIARYAGLIADRFGLREKALFQTWITDLTWLEDEQRWLVTTNRGDAIRARFVVLGTGPASRPRLPGIPGITDFKGVSFHTSRWDYAYTGGGPDGGLTGLADKRVAIIGTGATGVQVVPHLAASAQQLYVVQRTPSSILWRGNAATDPEWFAGLEPGWQARMWEDFNNTIDGGSPDPGLVDERGMAIIAFQLKYLKDKLGLDTKDLSGDDFVTLYDIADFSAMEEVRRRIDVVVSDRDKAEALKPWYKLFCKRPTPSDAYLPAFDRENVTLLDVSASKGLDRITETGIVAGGVEYEVDCIVYASGFEITSGYEKRIGIPIAGIGGESIYEHWSEGMRSMYSLMYHGFPNLFMVGGLFGFTLSLNYCTSVDDQAHAVAYTVGEIRDRGLTAVHPSLAAEEEWMHLQQTLPPGGPYASLFGGSAESCTPGYYNQEGVRMEARRDYRLDSFPLGANGYTALLHRWQDEGSLDGLEPAGTVTSGSAATS